jgi:hypothetical protein
MIKDHIQRLLGAWDARQQGLSKAIAANPRLRIMIGLTALVVLVELGMRWVDSTEAQFNERAQLQAEMAQLKFQTRDPRALDTALQYANGASKLASMRLLEAGSEALAQAKLQDWHGDLTREANLQVISLNVGNARPVTAKTTPPAAARPQATSQVASTIIEVPVTLAIRFTPESLSAVLSGLEGAQALVRIESISVRRLERRVDLGLVYPVRIKAGG